MPTFFRTDPFLRDWNSLTPEQKARFKIAVRQMVEDLRTHRGFRPGLRIKRVRKTTGIFEMTWARMAVRPSSMERKFDQANRILSGAGLALMISSRILEIPLRHKNGPSPNASRRGVSGDNHGVSQDNLLGQQAL